MSDFILEIYGEEIPSSAQSLIENQFEKLFSQLLEDNEIKYKDLLTFSTSRRVVVYINGLNNYINSKQVEVRGPQVDASQIAIQGFLKSNNLVNINLHSQKISQHSSVIARKGEIRKILKNFQINFAKKYKNCCIEGRDISTKILPRSDLKFFFKCNLNTAAKRRFSELKKYDPKIKFKQV